jgi:hypothetical protein
MFLIHLFKIIRPNFVSYSLLAHFDSQRMVFHPKLFLIRQVSCVQLRLRPRYLLTSCPARLPSTNTCVYISPLWSNRYPLYNLISSLLTSPLKTSRHPYLPSSQPTSCTNPSPHSPPCKQRRQNNHSSIMTQSTLHPAASPAPSPIHLHHLFQN